MTENRGRWAWLSFVILNALVTFFGASYIWFPGEAVVAANNATEGVLKVPRVAWGIFVMASALVMLVVGATGFRTGRRWAWWAVFYQAAFYFAVAAIEPDWLFPMIMLAIIAASMWRAYPRFFKSATPISPGRAPAPAR